MNTQTARRLLRTAIDHINQREVAIALEYLAALDHHSADLQYPANLRWEKRADLFRRMIEHEPEPSGIDGYFNPVAFELGASARKNGDLLKRNPFKKPSHYHSSWVAGWCDADQSTVST